MLTSDDPAVQAKIGKIAEMCSMMSGEAHAAH